MQYRIPCCIKNLIADFSGERPRTIGLWMSRKRKETAYLKWTSILTIALPAVLGVLVAVNWKWVFVTFHKIAFNNDYWIFDEATDPVITILPNAFFMHCALLIFGGVVIGSVICGLLYKRAKKK